MAFKLTTAEAKWLSNTINTIEAWKDDLKDVYAKDETADKDEAKTKLNEYEDYIDTVRAKVQDIAERFQEEFDEKSEKWQEGDRGQEVMDFISEWDDLYLAQAEFTDAEDGSIDEDHDEQLGNLPDAV